jgi:hypothetical protein
MVSIPFHIHEETQADFQEGILVAIDSTFNICYNYV